MSRAEGKAQTLLRLRAAARAVFRERGVHDASVQEIAQRAGVATGTFYVHFTAKSDVVDALVKEVNEGLTTALVAALIHTESDVARAFIRPAAEAIALYWRENYTDAPLFADFVSRNASEQLLRLGSNQEATAAVRKILTAVPSIQLACSTEFLVNTLVAIWRGFGLYVGTLQPGEVARAVDDLVRTTECLLGQLAPGMLDTNPTAIVAALLSESQSVPAA